MEAIDQQIVNKELYTILNSSGIPFRYYQFKSKPPIPYGVYLCEDAEHVFADGVTALQFDNIRIELYTDEKSPETEKQLTDTLTAAGIAYKKIDEVYIKEDKLYEIIYEI